jgi:coatomer subunit beta'
MITCSDDMLIKLWDWDKAWACTQVFEGHSHYVMQVKVAWPGAGKMGAATVPPQEDRAWQCPLCHLCSSCAC